MYFYLLIVIVHVEHGCRTTASISKAIVTDLNLFLGKACFDADEMHMIEGSGQHCTAGRSRPVIVPDDNDLEDA